MALTILTTYDPTWWGQVKQAHKHDKYEESKSAHLAAQLNEEHVLPLPKGGELVKLREKEMRTPLRSYSMFATSASTASPQPTPAANQSTPAANPESKTPGKR